MRHLKKSRRFGRSPSHRQAMFRNMVTSLFVHERIRTTLEKAKELRRLAERLVTLGKRGDLAARRVAAQTLRTTGRREGKREIHDHEALRKLFDTLAPRYTDRPGGYTRIIGTRRRPGDNASMAFIEMLPEERKAPAKKKSTKKNAPKGPSKGGVKSAAGKAAPKKGTSKAKAAATKSQDTPTHKTAAKKPPGATGKKKTAAKKKTEG